MNNNTIDNRKDPSGFDPIPDAARAYIKAGLSCTVCWGANAPPKSSPKAPFYDNWQTEFPDLDKWQSRYRSGNYIGIACGLVSGGCECLDFDLAGRLYEVWRKKIPPELFAKLYIERTPSGGFHVVFRSAKPGDNEKLTAVRYAKPKPDRTDGNGKAFLICEVTGKALPAGQIGTEWVAWPCAVETRGTGGQFVCAPSPGYERLQGKLSALPILLPEERQLLIDAARSLNEAPAQKSALKERRKNVAAGPAGAPEKDPQTSARGRPSFADWLNTTDRARQVLASDGWEFSYRGGDGNEHYIRPGKDDSGVSGNWNGKDFYCHSTSAAPLEAGRGYSVLQLVAALNHGGNQKLANQVLWDGPEGRAFRAEFPDRRSSDSGTKRDGSSAQAEDNAPPDGATTRLPGVAALAHRS